MKIKIEIDIEPGDQVRPDSGLPEGSLVQPRDDLVPLVIIGQGPYATLYEPDPDRPGRVIRRRPDGTLIDREM